MKRVAIVVGLAAAAILVGLWRSALQIPALDTGTVAEHTRERERLADEEARARRDRSAQMLQAELLRQELAVQEAKARAGIN